MWAYESHHKQSCVHNGKGPMFLRWPMFPLAVASAPLRSVVHEIDVLRHAVLPETINEPITMSNVAFQNNTFHLYNVSSAVSARFSGAYAQAFRPTSDWRGENSCGIYLGRPWWCAESLSTRRRCARSATGAKRRYFTRHGTSTTCFTCTMTTFSRSSTRCSALQGAMHRPSRVPTRRCCTAFQGVAHQPGIGWRPRLCSTAL